MIQYANFKTRLIAHIIDISLILLFISILLLILNPLPEINSAIFKEITYLIISFLYYSILTASSKHGSIGKQIMGIIVVNQNMQGISLSHSIGRYFAYYFSYITLGFGFLMIYLTKKHIGLHDKIANTYVIYRRET